MPASTFYCNECEGTFKLARQSPSEGACDACYRADRSTLALEQAWRILGEEEIACSPICPSVNVQSKLKRLRKLVYEARKEA